MNVQTQVGYLLGGTVPVYDLGGTSSPQYPVDTVDIFGQVYLSRLYAKNLDALEIASSGKVTISLNDVNAIDISKTTSILDSGEVVALTSTDSNGILLSTAENSASVYLSAASCNLHLSSRNDVHISCSNNIYMNAKQLIINVSHMTTSYAFAVADTGELQLQQHAADIDGNMNTRVVARFGIKHGNGVAATASNQVSLL